MSNKDQLLKRVLEIAGDLDWDLKSNGMPGYSAEYNNIIIHVSGDVVTFDHAAFVTLISDISSDIPRRIHAIARKQVDAKQHQDRENRYGDIYEQLRG